MNKAKPPVTVTTTTEKTFKNPALAQAYARALMADGKISRPEFQGVKRTMEAAKSHTAPAGKKR